jgi:hypothetical protein
MRFYIGIDDTDNLETRGTGFRCRELAASLVSNGYGDVIGISRHQLLFDRRIPYTSHNSSGCIEIETEKISTVIEISRQYLLENGAIGSDVGLCVAEADNISTEVIHWGSNAKKIILNKVDAIKLANQNNIFLEGLTGTHDGIIGALAAVGLRKSGNDGRYVWVKGKELRELTGTIFTIEDLKKITKLDSVCDLQGNIIPDNEKIYTSEWYRPVLKNNQITIFAEPKKGDNDYEWSVLSKEHIKSISD